MNLAVVMVVVVMAMTSVMVVMAMMKGCCDSATNVFTRICSKGRCR